MITWPPTKIITIIRNNRVGLIAISLTWLVFFSRLLTGRFVYFLDDLKIFYYPLEVAYAEAQAAWTLPHWSHLFGAGQPLLAWGQLGFFTPLHVILRALQVPPLELLQISVVTYFLVGLLGMFVFLRREQLSQIPAALGAIVFAFSGFAIGHLNHVNFYTGSMLLPWLLVAIAWLIAQPTRYRAVLVAVAAAAITLSAQPQIVLYTFIIATVVAIALVISKLVTQRNQLAKLRRFATKFIALTLVAGILAFLLSSLAILPLAEFLPLTERNDDLPEAELLDFSYAPWHAITLTLPYFFGDHATYWGAKGFQELAAFVGVLPLLLTGVALTRWHKHRGLRNAALALIIISLLFALGRFSPLYRYFVEAKILTSLSIPGRFVYFFDIGIAILAALGLEQLTVALRQRDRRQLWLTGLAGLAILAVSIAPFLWYLTINERAAATAQLLLQQFNISFALSLVGIVLFLSLLLFSRNQQVRRVSPHLLLATTALTLIVYSWNYNPVLARDQLRAPPFAANFAAHQATTGIPPRLYQRDQLIIAETSRGLRPTNPINPALRVYQPITLPATNPVCFLIPLGASTNNTGHITIALHQDVTGPALDQTTINARDIKTEPDQRICLKHNLATEANALLSFTSDHDSGINLLARPLNDELSAYIVRLANPTAEQIAASQKPLAIELETLIPTLFEPDLALLPRHLQSTAGASNATWIGALSIRPYREFVDKFLANDQPAFDGDGIHAIERERPLVNMLGITHLIHGVQPDQTDLTANAGFTIVNEIDTGPTTVRLFENPQAFPKAWLVPQAEWEAADDEVRASIILRDDFDPRELVYLAGDTPPNDFGTPGELRSIVDVTTYESTRTEIAVTTDRAAWLVLSDTSTPQWRTFIDDQPAPYYKANTFMKAAYVPAGSHIVSFRYQSDATDRAKKLSLVGLLLAAILVLPFERLWRRS